MDNYAPHLVLVLSVLLMLILTYRSFVKEKLSFNNIFVPASLLTNRIGLGAGFTLYVFLIMLAYTVITYYWGPLSDIVSPFLKGTELEKLVGVGNSTPSAIVPIVVAVIAAFALTWDAKYNPFGIILEFVHDLIRIPDKALTTLNRLKAAKFRRLSDNDAVAIAKDDDILECDFNYFQFDRRSLLYRWAHLCHLRYLLLTYLRYDQHSEERQKRGARVITALDWAELDKNYRDLAPRFGTWRKRVEKDADEAIEIFSAVQ
jgi:hypothetical protein